MKISVVIPVYNSQNTIEECIVSVVKSFQEYSECEYEIICIDDGSTDNSLEVLSSLQKKINNVKVVTQKNGGAASARNNGLSLATGDYIAFNDSDDKWDINHIKDIISILEMRKDVSCCAGVYDSVKMNTFILKQDKTNPFLYYPTKKTQLLKNFFSPPATIVRRNVIDDGLRFDPAMRYAEEGYFFLNITNKYKTCFLNKKVSSSILQKNKYGDCGLSGNLKEMEKGELRNLSYARKELGISLGLYFFAFIFSYIKYFKRIIITKIRKAKK